MRSILNGLLVPAMLILAAGCSKSGGGAVARDAQTAFYVDCLNGSDDSSGIDPAHAWRTLAKVSSSGFAELSSIYLLRGCTWNEQLTVPSSSITIDAYGAGALPRLDGSREVGGWTSAGSGLFSSSVVLQSGEALGNLSENGAMLSFLTWTAAPATTFSGAVAGTYSYDYASSTLYIKPATPPSGNLYRASVKIFGVTAVNRSDVTVRNLDITRFSLHGVHFQDCVRCGVYGTKISKVGGAVISGAPLIYAGNGVEFDNASTDLIADGVEVADIFDSGISPQTWLTGQAMSSVTITNSQISSCGFAGIEISVLNNAGTTGSSMTNVLVSGVTITASGRGWSGRRYGTEGYGIRLKADTGAGSISGVRIERTSISGSVGDGVKLAGDIGTVSLHRMDISDNADGINLQDPDGTSAKLRLTSSLVHDNAGNGISYHSPTAAGFELLQNTFSDNGVISLAVFSHAGAATVRNNIFSGSIAQLYSASTLTSAAIDNNCYSTVVNIGYNGVAYFTVPDLRSGTGLEAHGIGGTLGLADPGAGDYSLLAASDCKALGDPSAGITLDYAGIAFATPPSSGAFQFR